MRDPLAIESLDPKALAPGIELKITFLGFIVLKFTIVTKVLNFKKI